ncbi:MAG: D-alanyl-D-alanine carboxypeptidase/D-alanyl-D-alanine-endopeptidase [Acidobacteriota bacterium]
MMPEVPRLRLTQTFLAVLLTFSVPLAAASLQERVQGVIDAAPPSVRGWTAIQVVDLTNGAVLFAQNPDQLLLPASNLKLFTVAMALMRLNPDYRFVTRLVHVPSGDVTLIGAGDPSMSDRIYPSEDSKRGEDSKLPKNPLQAMEALADQAVAAGLTRIDGNVIGDDSRYAWDPYPASWTADDLGHEYGAPVSALTLNDNTIAVSVRPGTRPGQLAKVILTPPIEYFAIDNQVTTVAGRATLPVRMRLIPGTRQVLLTGTLATGSIGTSEIFPVDDPALFAATALYDALLRRGVAIYGRPVARHRSSGGASPEITGTQLARRVSPPLLEILTVLEKSSQNLHTELVLREAGVVLQKDGSLAGGLRALDAFLPTVGVNTKEVVMEDAAGLARNDEVTAQALTQLLQSMNASAYRDVWLSFLPVGGEDGTLSKRLCCTSGGRIRAKTGTLARSVALSGYADSKSSGTLAFAILVNNFAAPISEVRAWVDKLASALVE